MLDALVPHPSIMVVAWVENVGGAERKKERKRGCDSDSGGGGGGGGNEPAETSGERKVLKVGRPYRTRL